MTTFQDPPHQSRRALRESEREVREAANAAQEQNEAPANESLVPPAATPPAEADPAVRPSSAHSVSSVVEPSAEAEQAPQDAVPVVRSTGRRASRAAAHPGLIEVENSDGTASDASAQGEPLDYNTHGRRQVPSYDGPGPSFAQRLREAEEASARQAEAPGHNAPSHSAPSHSATGEQPQYRVRDFSPEGRRSAAYPTQPPAAPAEQAPADLDYRTQQSASEDAASLTAFPPAAAELPSLWSPQAAPATPFPLVEPVAPPSAFENGAASAAVPPSAAAPASAAVPPSAAAPESAAYPPSAASPESAAYPQSAAAPESAAYPQSAASPEAPAFPQSAAAPDSAAPESAAYPQSAAAPEDPAYRESAAAPQAGAFPESASAPQSAAYPQSAAAPESAAYPQSAAAPASVTEAPSFAQDKVEAPVEGPADAAPVAPQPEAPATPADSYSASVSRPDSVADSSGAPRGLTRRELRELRAREEAAAAALVEPELEVSSPDAVSEAIAEFEALSRSTATESEDAPAAWQPVENEPSPDASLSGTFTIDEPTETPTAASLFSTNQPFSSWLPAEPVAPASRETPAEQEAPVAPPVDTNASAHSAPVPLDDLIADPAQTPDTSIPRPFQWGAVSDEPAQDAAPVEDAPAKPTRDPHAASFEDLFAPVSEQVVAEPLVAEQPVAEQPVAEGSSSESAEAPEQKSTADLFSEALASAAPPAYEQPATQQAAPVEASPAEQAPEPFPRFDLADFAPPAYLAEPEQAPAPAPVDEPTPVPDAEPVLLLPAPPETPAASTNNTGTNNAGATSAPASPFGTPTPAATPQDFLTPEFVEPPTTTNSTYIAPAGHWSRQAVMDDETQPFENTLSREVGGGNVATTTSALILPTIPQQDFGTALTGAGEVLVTGTIDLPESFGTMGGDSRRYDNPDVDHVFDAFDNEVVSTDSAPVRATRAVSTHTNTHGVIHAAKPNGDGRLRILLIAASVLAVGVVALLVVAILNQ